MWTHTELKALETRENSYRLSEPTEGKRGSGRLIFEVKPNGNKYFYFRYFRKLEDEKSKPVFVLIDRFKPTPKAQGMTLEDARQLALNWGELLIEGTDIKSYLEGKALEEQARIQRIEDEKLQGSFLDLMESYLSAMKANGKRSHPYVRGSLKRHVYIPFPAMLNKKANVISSDDIQLILAKMIDSGITTHCNRVRSYLHTAFAHGLKQDNNPRRYAVESVKFNLAFNPVSHIPRQDDFEVVGEHVICEKDIRYTWANMVSNHFIAGLAFKLAIVTGQRAGEIVRLRWHDVDFDDMSFLIPSSVSKNKRDHIVPMNNLSLDVLKELHSITGESEFLFPAKNGTKLSLVKHMWSETLSKIILSFCNQTKQIDKFIARDIRRTWKTIAGKAGLDKSIRDRIQNHALTDVSSKHYDRYDYLPEKRQAMNIWNDYLDLIIHPEKKVTHINSKKKA